MQENGMNQEDRSDLTQKTLAALAAEMEERPWRIQPVDAVFVSRIQALTASVDIDLDWSLLAEPGANISMVRLCISACAFDQAEHGVRCGVIDSRCTEATSVGWST